MTARAGSPAGKTRRPLSRDNELIRQAEIRLRGHITEPDCYVRLLTDGQRQAVLRLSRASVEFCHDRAGRGLPSSKTFNYQGHKYWLWYSSFGRVIVAISKDCKGFVSSGFGAFGGIL